MIDYRYERKRLVSSSPDRYNAIGYSHNASNHHQQQQQPLEFWTNGTTTLILNSVTKEDRLKDPPNNIKPLRMTTQHRPDVTNNNAGAGQHIVRNSLIAGSVAGIASTLACHPFDVIRTKMQSAAMESALSSSSASSATTATTTTAGQGPIQVLSQTLKNGGVRALYTGLALPLAAQAVYKATIFAVNNMTQQALMDWNTRERQKTGIFDPYSLTMGDRFICGFMGGAVNAAVFVTPVEYVRNQLIRQHSKQVAGHKIANPYSGPMDVIRSTLQSNRAGLLGLWRGVGVTVARDSIGCGFFFYSMAWSQQYFSAVGSHSEGCAQQQQQPPSLGVTIFSGAVAGLAYWLAALPLDSVKTWVQSDMADSAIQSVQTSLRERGLVATLERLFSGFQVAYSRGIPSAAITVTTYTLCYSALQQQQPAQG